MMQGMASETREVTSVITVQGGPRLLITILNTKPTLPHLIKICTFQRIGSSLPEARQHSVRVHQRSRVKKRIRAQRWAGSWEVLSRFQDLNWAVPPLWHLQCLLGESPCCRPGHCWWLWPIVWRHTTLIRENGKKQQTFNSGKFYGEDFTPRISGLNVGTISRSSDGVHQQVGGDNLWCGGRAN